MPKEGNFDSEEFMIERRTEERLIRDYYPDDFVACHNCGAIAVRIINSYFCCDTCVPTNFSWR